MSITCLIPSHNDSAYLSLLLPQILQIELISQVVVVDDGTHPPLNGTPLKKHRNLELVTLKKNVGKASAIHSALRLAKHDTILLLDADIVLIDIIMLERYIKYFQENRVDLLIFPCRILYLFNRLVRHNILFAGPRLIQRDLLKKVFEEETPSRYQLEIAINRFMLRHNKRVKHGFLDYTPILKSHKVGHIQALISNMKMISNVLSYRFPSYLSQLFFFGHSRVTLCHRR
ncbi:glycosyltransferase [Candidatus Woesebacteria bacterium]|nr:glycosyltransferase [Candidatus Woesebacteria bacterium]